MQIPRTRDIEMKIKNDKSAGFTLVELLVGMVVLVVFFIAILGVLDAGTRVNKVESSVSSAQQAVRFASSAFAYDMRMARVGGLGMDTGVIPLYNNAPSGKKVVDAAGVQHPVRVGTDAVEIRGVISSPLFSLNTGALDAAPSSGSVNITVPALTVAGFYNNQAVNTCFTKTLGGTCSKGSDTFKDFLLRVHALDSGIDASTGGNATSSKVIPIVVGDTSGDYDVGTLTKIVVNVTSPAASTDTIVLTANFTDSGAMTYDSGGAVAGLTTPFSVGLLDDFLYFVHDGAECSEGGCTTNPDPNKIHPFLAKARRLIPVGGSAAAAVFDVEELVENVEDMQIAYGFDAYVGTTLPLSTATAGPDGIVYPLENVNSSGIVQVDGDEWFPNVAGDTITVPKSPSGTIQLTDANFTASPASFAQYFYTQATGTPTPPAVPSLRAVKVSIVAIGDQPDTQEGGYKGPGALGFTVMDSTAAAVSTTRPYHRRVFDFAVSLRNYTS